jgi:hypothetical protein
MTTKQQREEWARLAAYPYLDHESQMAAMAREAVPALLADLESVEANEAQLWARLQHAQRQLERAERIAEASKGLVEALESLIEWHQYEADPAKYEREHEGWVPMLPWRRAHADIAAYREATK